MSIATDTLLQQCTNPGHQVAWAAKFRKVATNMWGSYVWNLLNLTLLALGIWRAS